MADFNLKEELKKMKASVDLISDPKLKKAFIEQRTMELNNHADMLKRMSGFVNSKNKNGKK